MAGVIKKTMRVINNDEAQYSGSDRPALLVAGTANAAEIYNKDGKKEICTVKLLVCIIFPRVTVKTVTVAMAT
ncbi:hypothetical protein ACLK14_05400 [Escherichia coli]